MKSDNNGRNITNGVWDKLMTMLDCMDLLFSIEKHIVSDFALLYPTYENLIDDVCVGFRFALSDLRKLD